MNDESLKQAALRYPGSVSPPFDCLMERIGYEPLYELSEQFGGGLLYVPTLKKLFRMCVADAIVSEFNGYNHRQLANKYGYSVKGIRDILRAHGEKAM